ncbi:MAG: hypothetical protein KGO49_04255 [Gammaproteobacteria bacterium]|nr:hypothetical protein [Gammaproteobacteria bacterium]
MAKSVHALADEICAILDHGQPAWAIPWSDFYTFTERQTMRDSFKNQLRNELWSRSVLICFGQAIVLIAKDYPSAALLRK